MKKIFLTLSTIVAISCSANSNRSLDLSPEGEFTPGIEGAAHDSKGNLYAVNYGKEDGTIGIIPKGENKAKLYLTLNEGSIGNGIVFDQQGVMYIADYTKHNILSYDGDSLRVVAHSDKMNQPNDLAITPSGKFIFASDPNWEMGTGQLWRLEVKSGELKLMESEMGTTNGVEVSPDGKHLYINESKQLKVWKYDLDDSGEISNKRLFCEFEGYGMDGMRCDSMGNLYITRYDKGEVVKLAPSGELLDEWELRGKKCCNITLVGDRGYITMADRGCFEEIAL